MEFIVEKPGNVHFSPAEEQANSTNRDKRRKNPSRLHRDKKHAEQRLARRAGSKLAQDASQIQQALNVIVKHADEPGEVALIQMFPLLQLRPR
jgi:hypothetical protein